MLVGIIALRHFYLLLHNAGILARLRGVSNEILYLALGDPLALLKNEAYCLLSTEFR